MLSTNAKPVRRRGQLGFTLVELMAAALISLIVFAGLFSAYIYIARNITRIAYLQQQSLQSSRILHLFANDVGSATSVLVANNWQLKLQMAASTITYVYTPAAQTLQRIDSTPGTPAIVLTGISPLPLGFSTPTYPSNIFNFYNQAGTALLPAPSSYPPTNVSVLAVIDIRQMELSFMITDGVAGTGTLAQTTVVSSRIILRNKPPLGQ
jgi:Tfp pilus assembly protein PilV